MEATANKRVLSEAWTELSPGGFKLDEAKFHAKGKVSTTTKDKTDSTTTNKQDPQDTLAGWRIQPCPVWDLVALRFPQLWRRLPSLQAKGTLKRLHDATIATSPVCISNCSAACALLQFQKHVLQRGHLLLFSCPQFFGSLARAFVSLSSCSCESLRSLHRFHHKPITCRRMLLYMSLSIR